MCVYPVAYPFLVEWVLFDSVSRLKEVFKRRLLLYLVGMMARFTGPGPAVSRKLVSLHMTNEAIANCRYGPAYQLDDRAYVRMIA